MWRHAEQNFVFKVAVLELICYMLCLLRISGYILLIKVTACYMLQNAVLLILIVVFHFSNTRILYTGYVTFLMSFDNKNISNINFIVYI